MYVYAWINIIIIALMACFLTAIDARSNPTRTTCEKVTGRKTQVKLKNKIKMKKKKKKKMGDQ